MSRRWRCPRCDREFGRTRQSHECVPGTTVDAVFAERPPGQRQAYDAVLGFVTELGPVYEDAVDVGVFLKVDRKLAELRPKQRWLRTSIYLRRGNGLELATVRLTSAADVDDRVRELLTEAYDSASD